MKKVLSFLMLLTAVAGMAAEPERTWDALAIKGGREVFYNVKLLKVDDDALRISHSKGVARIPYGYLPAELQEEFGFDPVKAKAAREAWLEARKAEIRKEQAALAKERLAAVDRSSIKFEFVNVKVVRVVEGGLIVHRHQPGGAAGVTAQTVRGLLDRPRSFREPAQSATVEPGSGQTLWFLEGTEGKHAEGDVLAGYAGRYGTKTWSGRTLQRWIVKD